VAKITPFKALRFNTAKIKELGKVTAPPYDVISPKDQDFYYDLHPNNIVRLDFGKTLAGDNDDNNKYSRAATLLKLWREQGVLKTDSKTAFYVIAHDFVAPTPAPAGKKMTFAGVYALLKLEDYKTGVVKPHEKTLSKPKSDRMDLTVATGSNLSPIFFLFDDKKDFGAKWLAGQMKKNPESDFKSPNGDRHRLWSVTAGPTMASLQKLMAKLPVYIADGHHRYETMLKYSKEARGKNKEAAHYTLACFAPFQSKGMVILPTHRVILGHKNFHPSELLKALSKYFDVTQEKDLKAVEASLARRTLAFGLILGGALPYHSLALKKSVNLKTAIKDKRSDAYKSLDVAVLQALVLEDCLGMTPESIAAQENLSFEKSAQKAERWVLENQAQAAFLLNPTRMDQLQAVSDAKDVMPQKSTYFLPKLLTGQVLRVIE
jgi:uncharacterized protein (DUF1015 family)